ncbi:CASP-like protein 2D1 [Andrographis paniculata]|uniref:CASP-like protein 2D1 n=1 Tax=Andrographis paniculata TaxID=175694 RepID=UPI0021E90E14|nr:CASP-like protein 2D1 [Andrographis paniculata]
MGFLRGDVSGLKQLDLFLRLFVVPFVVATIWIGVEARQNNSDYGELGMDNLTGIKYMVCVSAVSGGYALFGAVCLCLRWLLTKAWLFFVADQILAYLMVTSVAAQGEFLYLAYNGDREVSWSEACGSYSKLCTRLRMALGVHVVAAACFLALAVISGYRLFRRFEPPYVPSTTSTGQ